MQKFGYIIFSDRKCDFFQGIIFFLSARHNAHLVEMTDKRNTYKKAAQPVKKPIRITFRVTEEEQTLILKRTREAGFETESEYLRYRCCFTDSPGISNEELLELKNDVTYCKKWIEEHREVLDNVISAPHLILKLLS